MREILVIAAVVLTTLSTSAGAQSTAAPQDSLAIARRFAEWFFSSQKDSLWAHSSDELKGQMKSPDEWTTALEQLTARADAEEKVLEEKFIKRNGRTQYWRTSKYSIADEPVMLRFALDSNLTIIGIGMNPQRQVPRIDATYRR